MISLVIHQLLITYCVIIRGNHLINQVEYFFTGYGPVDWGKVSQNCDKSAQSPINIETSSLIKAPNGKGLKLTCDNSGYVSGKIVNNGHAPTLNIDKTKGTCRLSGGPLGNSKYKLQQFHFHFGCKDDEGSEHTVDGDAYSGEVSDVIVH